MRQRKIKVRKYRDSNRPHELQEDKSRDVQVVVHEQPPKDYDTIRVVVLEQPPAIYTPIRVVVQEQPPEICPLIRVVYQEEAQDDGKRPKGASS